MPASARPNTVLTLDRLRLAVIRNTSAARRNGDESTDSADPVVSAVQAQTRAVREVMQRR